MVTIALAALAQVAVAQASPSKLEQQARESVSPTRGAFKVHGLREAVTVLRDRWGVPHIYARNQHDLFFAQGYVAAQDRLFQMELWKRSGQGRLAEVLGPSALARDINARLLLYRGDMNAEYASYSPDTREILAEFTDGINQFIAGLGPTGPNPLPVEFQIAGFRPEPWKPEDCLNRMAAFAMTGNGTSELDNAQLVAKVGAEQASSLVDLDPAVKLDPAPGINFAGLSRQLLRNLVSSDTRIEFPQYLVEGSNDWTISGAMTQTGKPLLANDPHRVIALPSLRYMVHLVAPGWNVIGAGEPALPGVALGHNEHIAWGFTIFGLDQQDLYLEEINPAHPDEYRTQKGWEKFRTVHERFGVRGGSAVETDLRFTRHGPVLWSEGNRALALRWVGAEPGTAGYLASLAVDRAADWKQFEAAIARWKLPSENIVYADRDGNIGEHSTGLSPIRKWTGLLPVPGAGGFEWTGWVPNSELPHSFNPEKGFIATANHKMIPDSYPYNVGFEWAAPYRIRRITGVLEAAREKGRKLTMDDMENLQTDVVSLPARELLGLLREAAGEHPEAWAQMLLGWDGTLARESAPAALYEIWMEQLSREVLHRYAPANTWALLDPGPERVLRELSHPRPEVFGTAPEAGRDRLLLDTLKAAVARLSNLEGRDPSTWSWGALHVVRFKHPLDQAAESASLLDRGPLRRPGDEYTINATGTEGSFEQVSGASYREILDLGNWDASMAANTPGQSGQPASPHYSDLMRAWDEGQYFPLLYSREAVEKLSEEKLELLPD